MGLEGWIEVSQVKSEKVENEKDRWKLGSQIWKDVVCRSNDQSRKCEKVTNKTRNLEILAQDKM